MPMNLFLTLLLGLSLSEISIGATSERSQSLQVSGSGLVKLPATLTKITLGVSAFGEEAGKVQAQVKEANNRLMSFLKKKKVNDLKTHRFTLQARTSYLKGKQKNEGFEGQTSISFSVPVGRAGELLDGGLKNGANEIVGVQFTAKDNELYEAEQRALKKASESALAKGKHVLKSLGLRYQRIDEVIVGGSRPTIRNQRHIMMAKRSSDAQVAIEGGDVEVDADVTLVLKYK